jgi:hypothetical protein
MKKILQKMAFLWIMLLSFMGSQKAKTMKMEIGRSGESKAREIVLDEYEISAYHSN